VAERDPLRHELADDDVQEGEDQVREQDRDDRRHHVAEGVGERTLADGTDTQRGERHAELHRRDETRRVRGDTQHVAGAPVALVVEFDDARAARRDEAVLGRDEEGVQQDENADRDELEEERHAPTPWALVLGGMSSSNYGPV
jgi:hypothetical protein